MRTRGAAWCQGALGEALVGFRALEPRQDSFRHILQGPPQAHSIQLFRLFVLAKPAPDIHTMGILNASRADATQTEMLCYQGGRMPENNCKKQTNNQRMSLQDNLDEKIEHPGTALLSITCGYSSLQLTSTYVSYACCVTLAINLSSIGKHAQTNSM